MVFEENLCTALDTKPAANTAAQLLKFKSVEHKRTSDSSSPTCVRAVLHAHASKNKLVDRLLHLGLIISYDRVLQPSAQKDNSVCQQIEREHVVCPPKMSGEVLTTAAVDNIDHNPSPNTPKDSFDGTAIYLIQHPSYR